MIDLGAKCFAPAIGAAFDGGSWFWGPDYEVAPAKRGRFVVYFKGRAISDAGSAAAGVAAAIAHQNVALKEAN